MNHRFKDITGNKYGILTVIDYSHSPKGVAYWNCSCECGRKKKISGCLLRAGKRTHCGCVNNTIKHGMCDTKEYSIWRGMRDRCESKSSKAYKDYGGRGITVDERWKSFDLFFEDMGKCPEGNYSLDRIDNNGPYSKKNCRWATKKQQANNRRNTRYIKAFGQTKSIGEWSDKYGISQQVIYGRLKKGWSPANSVSLPIGSRPKPRKRDDQFKSRQKKKPM